MILKKYLTYLYCYNFVLLLVVSRRRWFRSEKKVDMKLSLTTEKSKDGMTELKITHSYAILANQKRILHALYIPFLALGRSLDNNKQI